MSDPILALRGVAQVYTARKASGWGWTKTAAARAVNLEVHEGQTLAIVGESGSGKSTLAKLLLMLDRPTAGEVSYRGVPLTELDAGAHRRYRREIQAVFQDPASSLNPRMSVEQSLGHVARRHQLASARELRSFIARQLDAVGLVPAADYLGRFPHQLSGGQQQRIAIARAMMLEPRLIIADEPLSSLDVSIQAQVLELMLELRRRTGVGFVVISHDLGAMQAIAERTAVMYRGRIVEIGARVYERPAHPYTRLLLDARLATDPRKGRVRAAPPVRAAAPRSSAQGGGCSFGNRCPYAIARCAEVEPLLRALGDGVTQAACHRAEELADTLAARSVETPVIALDA